jgi:hypothetical protein
MYVSHFVEGNHADMFPRVERPYMRQFVCLYVCATRRHGNFAGVHTLLRILLSSNSAVLINIITGVSPPHFDFFVYYVLCQC